MDISKSHLNENDYVMKTFDWFDDDWYIWMKDEKENIEEIENTHIMNHTN